MRKIKFKGYNYYKKQWYYGLLIKDDKTGKDTFFIVTNSFNVAVETESIGQYTGFKDKNGVEIYEGDIIRADDDVDYTIEFDANNGWIGIHEDDIDMVHNLSIICNEFYAEVIGNIYEEKLKEI